MKNQHSPRSFLLGMITALTLLFLTAPALAVATRTIDVSTGVKICIDDVELRTTDSNGNLVEAFIYNGTTYLPVRAVSEALGRPVQWDGSKKTVYIGKHSSNEPAIYLADMDYFAGTSKNYFHTTTSERDNAGTTHYHCITDDFDRTYHINGQYSRIEGTLYQTYGGRSWQTYGDNYIEIYGDDKLLYTQKIDDWQTGISPINFSVDLTGVLELQVIFKASSNAASRFPLLSLGDVGLWT